MTLKLADLMTGDILWQPHVHCSWPDLWGDSGALCGDVIGDVSGAVSGGTVGLSVQLDSAQ